MSLTPQVRPRVEWIDTARGFTIVLVVLWHCLLAGLQIGEVWGPIKILNFSVFFDIRMPLFFFCSGLLAHWGLQKPVPTLMRRRIYVLLWVILVWTLISVAVEQILHLYPWGNGTYALRRIIWVPFGNLWFIYAIVINTLVILSLRKLSVPLQILGVALFALAVEIVMVDRLPPFPQGSFLDKITDYALFYFAAGYWLAPAIVRHFESARRAAWTFAAGGVVWIVMDFAVPASDELPRSILSLSALAVGMGAARLLCEWPRAAAPLHYVGTRTLEIFLLHQFFIAISFAAILYAGVSSGTIATAIIFVVTIVASLLAQRFISAARTPFLFRPPQLRPRRTQVA